MPPTTSDLFPTGREEHVREELSAQGVHGIIHKTIGKINAIKGERPGHSSYFRLLHGRAMFRQFWLTFALKQEWKAANRLWFRHIIACTC